MARKPTVSPLRAEPCAAERPWLKSYPEGVDWNAPFRPRLVGSLLDQAAKCMKEAPQVKVVVEGHGDERGTQEYNLALGEKRANAVKGYLKNLGVDNNRLGTRSKGENEPLCNESNESCWATNRRVQFIQQMK